MKIVQTLDYIENQIALCGLAFSRAMERADYDSANIASAQCHWWEWRLANFNNPTAEYKRNHD